MIKVSPNHSWIRVVIWVFIAVVVFLLLLFVLEKTHVIDLYKSSSTSNLTDEEKQAQAVANDVATAKENAAKDEVNNTSTDSSTTDGMSSVTSDANISIIFSAAGQDTAGGPIIIRTILENAPEGTCNLKLTQGAMTKSYEAGIIWLGNYYSCDGFNIDVDNLAANEWSAALTVITSTGSKTATKTIKVSK